MTRPCPLHFSGTGLALPATMVTSESLEMQHGLPAGWIKRRVGVTRRYYCGPQEDGVGLARQACQQALEQAGCGAADIDLVVAACGTYVQPLPYRAATLLGGMRDWFSSVTSFDVDATCLSFVVACRQVANALALGQHRRALIISSEVTSPGLDWRHPQAAALFGDGAAAAVVECGSGELLDYRLMTYPEGVDWCRIPGGGSRFPPNRFEAESTFGEFLFQMNGPDLYRLVAERLPGLVKEMLGELSWDDIDLVVPHQASPSAMRLIRTRLGCPANKFFSTVADTGNLVAASIPAALHLAWQQGRLRRGGRVLLLGTSAGVSLGACLFRF